MSHEDENAFWQAIERLHYRGDVEASKLFFKENYSYQQYKDFAEFVKYFVKIAYDKYENMDDLWLGGGDDSFSDALYMLVASGKEEFFKVLEHPEEWLRFQREYNGVDFHESFAYVFARVEDYDNYEEYDEYENYADDFVQSQEESVNPSSSNQEINGDQRSYMCIRQQYNQQEYEEDSDIFESLESSTESIGTEMSQCPNDNVITLERYDIQDPDIFVLYSVNTYNKFERGNCGSRKEMIQYIQSENPNEPSLISAIWKGGGISGSGGKPLSKFVIKMPPDNKFITLGSFDRIMNSDVKNWFLLPLYGGKRRRVGYEFGTSRNHGQIPGYTIYKAYTKQEIKQIVQVNEDKYDYPFYLGYTTVYDKSNTSISQLAERVGLSMRNIIQNIINHFVNRV